MESVQTDDNKEYFFIKVHGTCEWRIPEVGDFRRFLRGPGLICRGMEAGTWLKSG
jgi:hypothetical protein